jgi:hypothetical protein
MQIKIQKKNQNRCVDLNDFDSNTKMKTKTMPKKQKGVVHSWKKTIQSNDEENTLLQKAYKPALL